MAEESKFDSQQEKKYLLQTPAKLTQPPTASISWALSPAEKRPQREANHHASV